LCRARHALVTLIAGAGVHAGQVAIAKLAQHKGFTVLLQVDGVVRIRACEPPPTSSRSITPPSAW